MIPDALLVETFTPQTITRTTDNAGGYTEGWTDGTAFRGRLSTLSAEERMTADKTTVFATHKIYCNVITLAEDSRIKLGTRYFEIKGIVKPSNLDTGHLEILVRELD